MIEKEIERKIAFMHAIYGLLAGAVFGVYYKGDAMPFLGTIIWGVAISYPMMILTRSVFKLSNEDFYIKAWIGKGFIYFFLVWIVAWIFMYNIV